MNYSKTIDYINTYSNKEVLINKTACIFFGIITGITLTALSAFVRIPLPFTPVPITMQTMVVLLLGASLGRKWSAVTQTSYVLLGTLGAPIFAGASFGFAHLAGPTGGYLLGFIVAAFIVGRLIPIATSVSLIKILGAMFVGSIVILLLGTVQLAVVMHLNWKQAVIAGFLPFIPGDIIKSFVAAGIYHRIQSRCDMFK